jgi:hypothetical protein
MLMRAVLASLVAVLGWNLPAERMMAAPERRVDGTGGWAGGVGGLGALGFGIDRTLRTTTGRPALDEGLVEAVIGGVGATRLVAGHLSGSGTCTWEEHAAPQPVTPAIAETIVPDAPMVAEVPVVAVEPVTPAPAPVSAIEVVEASDRPFETVVDAMAADFTTPEAVTVADPAPAPSPAIEPAPAPQVEVVAEVASPAVDTPIAEAADESPYPGLAYELNFAHDGLDDGPTDIVAGSEEPAAPAVGERLGSAVRLTRDAFRAWADVLLPSRATVVAGKDRLAR